MQNMGKKGSDKSQPKGTRDDIEKEDEQEEFFKWLEENPNAGVASQADDEEHELEYDQDGNIIIPEKNKVCVCVFTFCFQSQMLFSTKKQNLNRQIIDPLPPIDHSTIEYEPFEKNFYQEHEEIAALTNAQTEELRRKLGIKVSGLNPPKPVCSFAHFNFDEPLMKAIRKSEFSQPTSIQAQAIPTALSGRDIIGIAKTGSGKTVAFIW